ncbi:MAG: hypothetical protein JST54_06950 [Deltaproteobacteria bacterium]|nr:hypothetical protein [Deltaproteobacteria bacterium]
MPRPNQLINVPLDEFLRAVVKSITLYMGAKDTLLLNGKTYTKQQFLAELANQEKPFDDVDNAHKALTLRIADKEAALPGVLTFANDYIAAIRSTYGSDPATLTKFAVPSRKAPRELTATEKVEKAAKAVATRKARGTMGSRQKEGIKATGDFTVSVGSTSSSQPTSSAPSAAAPVSTTPASQPASALAPAPTAAPIASTPVQPIASAPPVSTPAPAPVSTPIASAPIVAPVASAPAATPLPTVAAAQPTAGNASSIPVTNGVPGNGGAAPMLMNGSDH